MAPIDLTNISFLSIMVFCPLKVERGARKESEKKSGSVLWM